MALCLNYKFVSSSAMFVGKFLFFTFFFVAPLRPMQQPSMEISSGFYCWQPNRVNFFYVLKILDLCARQFKNGEKNVEIKSPLPLIELCMAKQVDYLFTNKHERERKGAIFFIYYRYFCCIFSSSCSVDG
jgi:hypothetical protein